MNTGEWTRARGCDMGHCVEVHKTPGVGLGSPTRFVRSSLGDRRVVGFTEEEWQEFIKGVKNGEFD